MMKSPLILAVLLASACAPGASPPASPSAASASGSTSTPQLREQRAAATLDRLAAKDFAGVREWFDAKMRDEVSVESIRDTWTQTEGALGPYDSRNFNGAMRTRGLIRLEYELVFTNGHARAHVTFNDDGTIAGLWIAPQGH